MIHYIKINHSCCADRMTDDKASGEIGFVRCPNTKAPGFADCATQFKGTFSSLGIRCRKLSDENVPGRALSPGIYFK